MVLLLHLKWELYFLVGGLILGFINLQQYKLVGQYY